MSVNMDLSNEEGAVKVENLIEKFLRRISDDQEMTWISSNYMWNKED